MSSADDSMELEYGLPATQPVHIEVGNRRPNTRIGWQDSQPGSQNPLASLMSGADSRKLFLDLEYTPEPLPEPFIPLPSTSATTTHNSNCPDRRRRKGRADELASVPAKQSAVLATLEELNRLVPEQTAFSRPQTSIKENQYAREERTLKAIARARKHEPSGSSDTSSGLRTPPNDDLGTTDSEISFDWPLRAGTSAGGSRTRSLGSGQARIAASLSSRHQSLPQLSGRVLPDLDVTMETDKYAIRDQSVISDFDSPISVGKGISSLPEADDSPRPINRHPSSQDSLGSSQCSPHSLPDTSRMLSGSSQAVLAGLRINSSRSSSPSCSTTSARVSPRVLSSSSSTTVPMQDSTSTSTLISTSSNSSGEARGLKRTASRPPLSRDQILYAMTSTPPPQPRNASPLHRAPILRPQPQAAQTHKPLSKTLHMPSATQRSKALGMLPRSKPYEPPPSKKRSPKATAEKSSHRIGGFKTPQMVKTEPSAPPPPLGNRSVQPVHAARAQPQPPPQPQAAAPRAQKPDNSDDEDSQQPHAGDISFGDVSFDIDMKELDECMGQYD